MTSEEEVALYLEDDQALGRFVSALEACGYIAVNPRTQVAKRGEVTAYKRRYSERKGRDKQIHVQVVKARNPGCAYWVYAHTEPYAGKLFKHLVSAILSMHDYADGAYLLCKDLGLPTP